MSSCSLTRLPREVWWVRLLHTQPGMRPGWWKGKFALFQTPAGQGEDGGHLSRGRLTAPPPKPLVATSEARAFPDRSVRGRSMQKQPRQLVESHLQIGRQWSDQHHLDCFRDSEPSGPGLVCLLDERPDRRFRQGFIGALGTAGKEPSK